MLNVLSRIPVKSQKSISGGLLYAASLAAMFGFFMFMLFMEKTDEKCTGHLWSKKCTETEILLGDRLPYLLLAVGLVVVALICVLAALRLITIQGHLKGHLAILTGVESMRIQQIADIVNSRPSKVRDEIQSMIDSEMISDFYIDYNADQVVSKKYVPKTSHKTVVTCSGCGGNNELIVGITRHCSFCGESLVLRTT